VVADMLHPNRFGRHEFVDNAMPMTAKFNGSSRVSVLAGDACDACAVETAARAGIEDSVNPVGERVVAGPSR